MAQLDHAPKGLDAVVEGRVQGVGFRWSTRREAERLGLVGTVRNRSDGAVVVAAEGRISHLEAFVEWLAVGPPAASVSSCHVTWREARGLSRRFEVVG
jgi:acylphosphatase